MWNVAFISGIYLIHKQVLPKMNGIFGPDNFDPDMAMCKNLRKKVSQVTLLHPKSSFRAAIKGVIFKTILAILNSSSAY